VNKQIKAYAHNRILSNKRKSTDKCNRMAESPNNYADYKNDAKIEFSIIPIIKKF
jgi:hypothetical protein